jgi:hypothetical protein
LFGSAECFIQVGRLNSRLGFAGARTNICDVELCVTWSEVVAVVECVKRSELGYKRRLTVFLSGKGNETERMNLPMPRPFTFERSGLFEAKRVDWPKDKPDAQKVFFNFEPPRVVKPTVGYYCTSLGAALPIAQAHAVTQLVACNTNRIPQTSSRSMHGAATNASMVPQTSSSSSSVQRTAVN